VPRTTGTRPRENALTPREIAEIEVKSGESP